MGSAVSLTTVHLRCNLAELEQQHPTSMPENFTSSAVSSETSTSAAPPPATSSPSISRTERGSGSSYGVRFGSGRSIVARSDGITDHSPSVRSASRCRFPVRPFSPCV